MSDAKRPNLTAEQWERPLKVADIKGLFAGIGPVIKRYVDQQIEQALIPLQTKVKVLEANTPLYLGTWRTIVYTRWVISKLQRVRSGLPPKRA